MSFDDRVLIPGCICENESCNYIGRLREFTRSPESEFAPLRDLNPEKFRSIQLRCPKCRGTEITVGEVEADPNQGLISKVLAAISCLNMAEALKEEAREAMEQQTLWGLELLAIAAKA